MLPQNNPDRIRILFDDRRLAADAGAACAIRSGRGNDARFRSGDAVERLPPGLPCERTSSSVRYVLPTHEYLCQRRRSRLSRAFLDSTATKQSSRFSRSQNLVVSLSSQTLGVRIRTALGRRV